MIHCDAVLIYYGNADRSWVDMKLMNLMKAPGYGRENPFTAKTVYLAPPMDRRKQRYRTHSAEVVVQEGIHSIPPCSSHLYPQLKNNFT